MHAVEQAWVLVFTRFGAGVRFHLGQNLRGADCGILAWSVDQGPVCRLFVCVRLWGVNTVFLVMWTEQSMQAACFLGAQIEESTAQNSPFFKHIVEEQEVQV